LEPYDAQNQLAWAASFILVLSILSVNIFSRILAALTEKTKRV
jgi:phosphate transport system permease protein